MNLEGPKHKFALMNEPMDYQLTVHYHNYNSFVGKEFMKDFEYMKAFMEDEVVQKDCPVMFNLISYYGVDKIQMWLNEFIIRNVA